ncbi:unnamed protein product [Cyprideis torosa]|uniref:glutathione transferase n=1 Tax=Cyprideis torosa TaxID=163714 RepID=A0A7R8ZNK8_9CRUS|nr:unnamed protein product [Cyprideis torosa]CAG0896568.1 unnamed protein product [Cyprideis torosa]
MNVSAGWGKSLKGEVPRLVLAQSGLQWEDYRIKKDEWPELKKRMPFRQVPALEFDGTILAQGNAISRFIARKSGLAGNTELESAQCDMWVDYCMDLATLYYKWRYGKEEEKPEAGKKLFEEFLPNFMKKTSGQINANGGWLVGKKLTWADLTLFYFMELMALHRPDVLEGQDELNAFHARVKSQQPLSQYLEKRAPLQ